MDRIFQFSFFIFILSLNSALAQENDHILNCAKSSGHHAYLQDYECPIGGEKFESLYLGTHSRFGVYLDWAPISYMDLTTPMPVCPSNGFVMTEQEYTEDRLQEIRVVIDSQEYKDLYAEKHATYYLYAHLSKVLGENQDNVWWILLNATWEAYNCGNDEKYKLYALEAIDAAKVRIKSVDKTESEFWALNLIIPNLYRRIEDFENANIWLKQLGDIPESAFEDPDDYGFYKRGFNLLREAIAAEDTSHIQNEEEK